MNGKGKAIRHGSWVMCAAALGAGWLLCPETASAGHLDVRLVKGGSSVWVPPVYETSRRVVTIPAVCEERPRRIWREPVYEVRRVLVHVPAKVTTRRVARRGRYGQVIGFKTVRHIIEPARQVWRTQRVLVRAGYYETVYERVCGQLRTTKVVYEKVLVRPGHWVQPRVTKVRHRPRLHRILRPHRLHRAGEDEWRVAFGFGW